MRDCCVFLQVADNGRGIAPHDYEALALKYHTSKLAQFGDLEVRCGQLCLSMCPASSVAPV